MKTLRNKPSIYLGIDPGTSLIGYGVVAETSQGFSCIDYGVVVNPSGDQFTLLKDTHSAIQKLIEIHKPNAVAIEKLFFFKNQKTVMPVSEVRGVILLALAQAKLRVHELTPLQVKLGICNYGMADKKQVQRVVKEILKLKTEIHPDDAADALALAICCATIQKKVIK